MIKVTMTQDKETKGTIRYSEEGNMQYIGTLYIRKHASDALGGAMPTKIEVTIE